jgi:hypothetical protein
MLELHAAVGKLAGAVALAGFVPYSLSILHGQTRPNRATWWIWAVVGAVSFAGYVAAGGRDAIWVPLSYVLGPLVTAILALRLGEGGWGPLECVCLAGSLAALILWALSGSPALALVLNIAVDLLGALPTFWKAWAEPESEDALSWGIFCAGNVLNLLAIDTWTLAGAAYPVYLFVLTAAITAVLIGRRAIGTAAGPLHAGSCDPSACNPRRPGATGPAGDRPPRR